MLGAGADEFGCSTPRRDFADIHREIADTRRKIADMCDPRSCGATVARGSTGGERFPIGTCTDALCIASGGVWHTGKHVDGAIG